MTRALLCVLVGLLVGLSAMLLPGDRASGQIDPVIERFPKPPFLRLPAEKATDCAADRDVDGDGHDATACGGDDCDDRDRQRYPSNTERCEGRLGDGRPAADLDEDCDSASLVNVRALFDGDEDQDGFISHLCSNFDDASRRTVRGNDCDDELASVSPGAQICGGIGVRICHAAASPGLRLSTAPGIEGYSDAPCPSGTSCTTQPNGLGLCS